MLTKKQKELLLFIHERLSSGEIAPSFDEMKNALGLKSKSGIHRLITALVERGYIQRLPHRARALEVKKLPEGYILYKNTNNITQKSELTPLTQSVDTIPLYGKIAAGSPIEAIRDEGQVIDIPAGMAGKGDLYALTVDGDSMIKAGINDGDTVIIKRQQNARDGDIVVALIDGEEVTLKRIYRKEGKVVLQPENDEYAPKVLSPEQVEIQGVISSLIRTYH